MWFSKLCISVHRRHRDDLLRSLATSGFVKLPFEQKNTCPLPDMLFERLFPWGRGGKVERLCLFCSSCIEVGIFSKTIRFSRIHVKNDSSKLWKARPSGEKDPLLQHFLHVGLHRGFRRIPLAPYHCTLMHSNILMLIRP